MCGKTDFKNRRDCLLGLTAALTIAVAGNTKAQTVSPTDVLIRIEFDSRLDPGLGEAQILLDGDLQGFLSPGCGLSFLTDPGPHLLEVVWPTLLQQHEFTARVDGNNAFMVTPDARIILDPRDAAATC